MGPELALLSAVVGWFCVAFGAPEIPLGEVWIAEDPILTLPLGVGRTGEVRNGVERLLVEPAGLQALAGQGVAVFDYRPDHRLGPLDPSRRRALAPSAGAQRSMLLGYSREGRPIAGTWFGQDPDSGAPSVRVIGGHHGDERPGVDLAWAVARRLADGDPMLDQRTVFVVPEVNPDGIATGSRLNAQGVDLNRNYDLAWSDEALRPGQAPFSEPETRAVRRHALHARPALSLALHAGAVNLGWPWNHTTAAPADARTFESLAATYAATCTAPGFWVTQGSHWYTTTGDLNDWAYARFGTLDLTLELSEERDPPDRRLDDITEWHIDAIMDFLATPLALTGTVTDSTTGDPVIATLRDHDGLVAVAHPVTGRFHAVQRPDWLLVEAAGYFPVEVFPQARDILVTLMPDHLALGALPDRVVSAPRWVDLPSTGGVWLAQPGRDVQWLAVTNGVAYVHPEVVGEGWFDVTLPDGTTYLRGLLVAPAEGVSVEAVDQQDGTVTVLGGPFTPDTRVYSFSGDRRVPTPAAVQISAAALVIEVPSLGTAPRDLLIHTNGTVVGLADPVHTHRHDRYANEPLTLTGQCGGCALPGTHSAAWGQMILLAVCAWRSRHARAGGIA